MSWAGWNRDLYRHGEGLGSLFFLNEEGQLEVNPDFWAYRVYLRDNSGRYLSPSRKARNKQNPVGMNEWNREHGASDKINKDSDYMFDGTRGMDDVYDEVAENVDLYEADLDDGFFEKADYESLRGSMFDGGNFTDNIFGNEAYILDQGAGDRAGRVIVTGAPYTGISIIGASHPRYNIFGTGDVDPLVLHGLDYKVNQHNKGNAVGATALAHDAIRRLNENGKMAWGGYDTPIDHVLVESLKSGKGPLWMSALTAGDRERLGSARSWSELKSILNDIDLENAKRGIKEYDSISNRLREQNMKDNGNRQPTKEQKNAYRKARNVEYAFDTMLYPNDRISGAIITDAAPFGAAGIDFDNMMHDKVVEAIMRSLDRFKREEPLVYKDEDKKKVIWKSGPDDVRLVQVAVPLRTAFGEDNLFTVDDIRAGRVHGKRSDMNEYIARVVKPFNDIGSAAEFLGNGEDNPFRLYWLARLSGLPASEAWRRCLGARFGDIQTLISDEELKDTKRLAREACEPLLRQCMIVNGITRGL